MTITPSERLLIDQYMAIYAPIQKASPNYDFIVGDTANTVSKDFFGDSWCKAVAFKTAHNLYMSSLSSSSTGASGNIVVSKTIGPVSLKFSEAQMDNNNTYFMSTFGRMYDELKRSCNSGILTTML